MQQSPTAATAKPLEGVRILDFTRVLAGPYCTALMADLGADVIKVESAHGDDYRHIGPFNQGESLLFQAINRGKRSIVLNLKSADDIATIKKLMREADVLIENFRPGVMQRLGLGFDAVHAEFPALVYVSISGFGQTGPNAGKPAYDIIIQAMSGLMDVTGEPDGTPTMIGEAVGDVAGGLFAAWGTMVALFDRARTGKGQLVDVGLFDALTSMMPLLACRTLMAGDTPTRTGNRHSLSAPFGIYPSSDGHFAVAILSNSLFAKFCEVIEQPELATDGRFSSDTLRRENEPALARYIEHWSRRHRVTEIVASLSTADIPASEIQSIAQAWASTQVVERGLASEVSHPILGPLYVPEQPVHFGDAPRGGRKAAPGLNANEKEILAGLSKGPTR